MSNLANFVLFCPAVLDVPRLREGPMNSSVHPCVRGLEVSVSVHEVRSQYPLSPQNASKFQKLRKTKRKNCKKY